MVKDADVIVNDQKLPEVKNWQRLKELQGREVVTPGGTKLGTVGDVILDEVGQIVGLHLSRVLVKGPLAETGSIPREAVVHPNMEDGTIGVDLALLEKLVGGIDEESLKEEAAEPSEEPAEEEVQEPEEEEIPIEVIDGEDADENDESAAEPAASESAESAGEDDLDQ